MAKEKPPVFGMIQRTGEVVIRMLADVKQRTIGPLIKAMETGVGTTAPEIARLSESITKLAEKIGILAPPATTLAPTSTASARTTPTVPTAQTTARTAAPSSLVFNVTINGANKDGAVLYDEIKTEATRRARASANPDVKRTVSLLP